MAQFIHPAGLIVKVISRRLAYRFWVPAISDCRTNRFGELPAAGNRGRLKIQLDLFE